MNPRKTFLLGTILIFMASFLFAIPQEAQKYWKKGEWRKAALVLDQYLSKNPKDFKGLLFRARTALLEKDLVRAEEFLDRAKKIRPSSPEVFYYLGRAASGRRRFKESLGYLEKARQLRPRWFKIYLQKAWLHLGRGEVEGAYQSALMAKKLAPKESEVYSLLGYVYFRKQKISQARLAFLKALELDKINRTAHWYLGTGLGFSSSNQKLRENSRDWENLQKSLKDLHRKNFDEALSLFQKLLKKYPRNGTLHFLLAEAQRQRDFGRHRLEFFPAYKKLSKLLPSSKVSEKRLAHFFINYKTLTEEEKKALQSSTAPFQKYLPLLEDQFIAHHILPLEQRIGEVPSMGHLRNRFTHDGRRYEDIRGLTDRTAISGRETLFSARAFAYNTLAHELAHQVHMNALSYDQKKEILRLYRRALREKKYLDYYAASTVYEYFAQGYEAFISRFKRTGLAVTSYHTRKELREKDPDLYRFLKKITLPVFSREQLAGMYYWIGQIYQDLKEKEKAKGAFEMATYLALGMMERD